MNTERDTGESGGEMDAILKKIRDFVRNLPEDYRIFLWNAAISRGNEGRIFSIGEIDFVFGKPSEMLRYDIRRFAASARYFTFAGNSLVSFSELGDQGSPVDEIRLSRQIIASWSSAAVLSLVSALKKLDLWDRLQKLLEPETEYRSCYISRNPREELSQKAYLFLDDALASYLGANPDAGTEASDMVSLRVAVWRNLCYYRIDTPGHGIDCQVAELGDIAGWFPEENAEQGFSYDTDLLNQEEMISEEEIIRGLQANWSLSGELPEPDELGDSDVTALYDTERGCYALRYRLGDTVVHLAPLTRQETFKVLNRQPVDYGWINIL
ncbi:hypothetical protein [Succinimonas amylolytica]|uniref:hypothetical protein n=1 Tax=Succinimonas amylolytica TaxID=83769 RepID=UPI0003679989|nr:hypothetical protein [Succinimonas amylolytica]